MLSYLRGIIQSKEMTGSAADRLVVEVQGVGFELSVSHPTLMSIGQPGDCVTVHTSLSIRENDWTIFGFATADEREMFCLLQSVSGVGPKLALAIIGTLKPDEIARAILSEDPKMISQAPGVGSKVAQRLILELRAKIEDWQRHRGQSSAEPAAAPALFNEVRSILSELGYTATEINLALRKIEEDKLDQDVELMVRHSLKVLAAT